MRQILVSFFIMLSLSIGAQKQVGLGTNWIPMCDTLTGEQVMVEPEAFSGVDDCCYFWDGTNYVKRANCDDVGKCKIKNSSDWCDQFIEGGLDNTGTSFTHTGQNYIVDFDDGTSCSFQIASATNWSDQVTQISAGLDGCMSWAVESVPYCTNGCGGLSAPFIDLSQMIARYSGFKICPGDPVPTKVYYTSDQNPKGRPLVLQTILSDKIYLERCSECGGESEFSIVGGDMDGQPFEPVCPKPCAESDFELPEPACSVNTVSVCEIMPEITDGDGFVISPIAIVTNNVFLQFTTCDTDISVFAYTLVDGTPQEHTLSDGNFYGDCETLEEVGEPSPECPADAVWEEVCETGYITIWDNSTYTLTDGSTLNHLQNGNNYEFTFDLEDGSSVVYQQTADPYFNNVLQNISSSIPEWTVTPVCANHTASAGCNAGHVQNLQDLGNLVLPNPYDPSTAPSDPQNNLSNPAQSELWATGWGISSGSCIAKPLRVTITSATNPAHIGATRDLIVYEKEPIQLFRAVTCDGVFYKDCFGNDIKAPTCKVSICGSGSQCTPINTGAEICGIVGNEKDQRFVTMWVLQNPCTGETSYQDCETEEIITEFKKISCECDVNISTVQVCEYDADENCIRNFDRQIVEISNCADEGREETDYESGTTVILNPAVSTESTIEPCIDCDNALVQKCYVCEPAPKVSTVKPIREQVKSVKTAVKVRTLAVASKEVSRSKVKTLEKFTATSSKECMYGTSVEVMFTADGSSYTVNGETNTAFDSTGYTQIPCEVELCAPDMKVEICNFPDQPTLIDCGFKCTGTINTDRNGIGGSDEIVFNGVTYTSYSDFLVATGAEINCANAECHTSTITIPTNADVSSFTWTRFATDNVVDLICVEQKGTSVFIKEECRPSSSYDAVCSTDSIFIRKITEDCDGNLSTTYYDFADPSIEVEPSSETSPCDPSFTFKKTLCDADGNEYIQNTVIVGLPDGGQESVVIIDSDGQIVANPPQLFACGDPDFVRAGCVFDSLGIPTRVDRYEWWNNQSLTQVVYNYPSTAPYNGDVSTWSEDCQYKVACDIEGAGDCESPCANLQGATIASNNSYADCLPATAEDSIGMSSLLNGGSYTSTAGGTGIIAATIYPALDTYGATIEVCANWETTSGIGLSVWSGTTILPITNYGTSSHTLFTFGGCGTLQNTNVATGPTGSQGIADWGPASGVSCFTVDASSVTDACDVKIVTHAWNDGETLSGLTVDGNVLGAIDCKPVMVPLMATKKTVVASTSSCNEGQPVFIQTYSDGSMQIVPAPEGVDNWCVCEDEETAGLTYEAEFKASGIQSIVTDCGTWNGNFDFIAPLDVPQSSDDAGSQMQQAKISIDAWLSANGGGTVDIRFTSTSVYKITITGATCVPQTASDDSNPGPHNFTQI